MYVAELVLEGTHYYCSRLLARAQHEWLLRLVRGGGLRSLLDAAEKAYKLLDLREELRGLGDIRVSSAKDLFARICIEDDDVRRLVASVASAVGYSNIVQFLADRHTLLILYGAAVGCHEPSVYCVLEPRFEVENHDLSKELEGKSLLPYRLFDLLVVEGNRLRLIEVKYILSREKNPRGTVPGGTMLAHLASFVEKLVSTAQLLHEPLRTAGYTVEYHFVAILGPGREIKKSVWKHIEKITGALESLIEAPVEPHNTLYIDIAREVQNANPTPPYAYRAKTKQTDQKRDTKR
ncbi:hypothetical protein [Pyrolobus fumarii]|uniref:hypothetical protein n=1 Tax=Pyrolobus fumarii TaxID=54252 RepID=UPI00064FE8B3|nr:hypothetical protein [Pyrolobus fumarii]